MNAAINPDLNEALAGLLRKYEVDVAESWQLDDGRQSAKEAPTDALTLLPGSRYAESELPDQTIPLLPWRSERRFLELKSLVQNQTITPVLMCRFACITNGVTLSLPEALYREFDLAEWLSGAPIAGVYAAIEGDYTANAIVRLENDVICSVEAATTLPAGTRTQDRHEIIARRGVASDRVVDTQVPQSSVYVWSDLGPVQFTDTDTELLGLDSDSVALVRSAYDALIRPESHDELRRKHARLHRLVALAFESNRSQQRLTVEGGAP